MPTAEDQLSQKKEDNIEYPLLVPVEVQDDYESPQKCFDLSQARAMFMPHKVPPRNGLEAADSQEELRKLTGYEIWELTRKAAELDYQRTAERARQQLANEGDGEGANDPDAGFGLALAEALGFQDDPEPARTQSHLRRGLLLSDDGEESLMHEEQQDATSAADPVNLASGSHNPSPREVQDSIYRDLGKRQEARYSHAGAEKDKKTAISANSKQ